MDKADILERMVEAHRWRDIALMLGASNDDELASLRRWYRRSGRAHARRAVGDWAAPGRSSQLMLAVTLPETPEEASACCEWGRRFVWHDDAHVLPAVVPLLAQRGREWCAGFVVAAARARITTRTQRAPAAELGALLMALLAHFDLDVPDGEQYAHGWTQLTRWVHVWSTHAERRRYPWESMRPIVISADGHAAYAFANPLEVTLDQFLAATPRLHDTMVAALGVPNALAEFADLKDAPWSLEESIRTAVRDGRLDRVTLFEAALEALTRTDTPATQRVVARLLRGLDLTPDDVQLQLPLITHILPTVHGAATAELLRPLLAAKLSADDLRDVGGTILSRKEKAQKTALLRHLTSAATRSGPAADAVVPLLTLAAASDDTAFAARAAKPLAAAGVDTDRKPDTVDVPWDLAESTAPTEPFRPAEPSRAGLKALTSDLLTYASIAQEARWLDAAVRLAARDPDELRTALTDLPDEAGWNSRAAFLLRQWARTGNARRSHRHSLTPMHLADGAWQPGQTQTFEVTPAPHEALTDGLVTETIGRFGAVQQLLSTPSREDGSLTLTDLAGRIEASAAAGYGRFDLLQALLRLDPSTTADLHVLDGLRIAPAGRPGVADKLGRWFRRGSLGVDGVAVVRAWVEAGGLPVRRGSAGVPDVPAVRLPAVLGEVEIVAPLAEAVGPGSTVRVGFGTGGPALFLGVLPSWAEALVSVLDNGGTWESVQDADRLRLLEHCAGPLGPAIHRYVARLLGHHRQDCRATAVQSVLDLMRQDRLDPELLSAASVALLGEGQLPLARTAWSWEQVILGGGLRRLWPAVHAVLEQASAAPRRPAGLADLLRTIRPYVGVVAAHADGDVLPPSLRRLAAGRGSSKTHVEARALVAALAEDR